MKLTPAHRRADVPAILHRDKRAWLRIALLAHYDADDAFRTELRSLVSAGAPTRERVDGFAKAYGLDRLIAGDGLDTDGVSLVRRWTDFARQWPEDDDGLGSALGFRGGGPGTSWKIGLIGTPPTSRELPRVAAWWTWSTPS